MKVSRPWLKELVELKVSEDEIIRLLPLRTIALKNITEESIELDMKGYNRADLLSMRGVAYEVAAITDSAVKFEESDPAKFSWVGIADSTEESHLKVEIEDQKLCPVYCLAKIERLKVGPSSPEWVQKLLNSGMRSVNNIADVTNLVMLEYGQPLHSFDEATVKDQTIIVRNAKDGEVLETLDQKKRKLEPTDLLITDREKSLGLAGVMGGKNSEITDDTTTILLEAAIFDPANLRKTSTRLGLQSEASKRFYHGLTRKRLLQSFDAAIKMYQELGGKLTALSMTGDLEDQQPEIPLRLEKINKLIGVDIPKEKVEDYLKKLGFTISDMVIKDEQVSWVITPPYFRLDVEIEEDLIEEVARMYGYENIPAKPLVGEIPAKIDQSLFELIGKLKSALVDQGLTEIQTYSFFSTQVLKNLGWLDTQSVWPLIKIANPISSETEYLRHNLWSNLIEKAAENLKYFDQVAIFEIGKTYEIIEGKIKEEYRVAVLIADGGDNPIATLNHLFQKALESQNIKLEISEKLPQIDKTIELFHPNRAASYKFKDQVIGGISEIHPKVVNKFGTEKRMAIAEIKLEELLK